MHYQIYPVHVNAGTFQWKWRCEDGKHKSQSDRSFELFYDCVEDARSHGADIDLEHVHQEISASDAKLKVVAHPKRG